MYTINRAAAVIKPKQPFADWVNSQPTGGDFISLEELRTDCDVYLIPDYDTDKEAHASIKDLATDIFEMQLEAWVLDPSLWPRKRDFATFQKWFDVEIHSVVIDPFENEVEKEEY